MDITGIGSIADLARDALDKFIPDPQAKAAAQLALFQAEQAGEFKEMDQQLALAKLQTDTNNTEAASSSLFVAGWRPFVGWVCGSGFAMIFVIGPMLEWLANLFGHSIKFPILDTGTLTTLLMAMLGLAGMRSYDKTKGVDSGH